MALADILERIGSDSGTEAGALIAAAEKAAEETRAAARARAEHDASVALARGQRLAESEAETIRASARLAARDAALTARRALIDEVLATVADDLLALPDDRYLALFAGQVAAVARGNERVHVAAADAARLQGLPAAVEKAAGRPLALEYPAGPAEVDHGVVLEADRARVDLSLDALIDGRRGDLEMLASRILFPAAEEA